MTISKAKTFRNIIYTSFGKGLTLFCFALTSMVVGRNLTPADYGVLGFAGIIIGFLSRFSDMSVGGAVIRRPELRQHNLETALRNFIELVQRGGVFPNLKRPLP
jgi:O-antigen/teichoic acid export membrane protein